MCYVCAEANDGLVLAANVVGSLMQRQSQVGLVQVNAVQNDDDVSDDDDCTDDTVAELDVDNDVDCTEQQQSNSDALNDVLCGL